MHFYSKYVFFSFLAWQNDCRFVQTGCWFSEIYKISATTTICDPFCQNGTRLCTWPKLSFWYIIKVDILSFIMVVKILNLDNPKRSYVHLTFGVLKIWNGEIGFQSLRFIIASIANWARYHPNYSIYTSNFDLKLSQYI